MASLSPPPLPSLQFCQPLFARGVLTAQPWRATDPAEQAAVHELIASVDRLARLDAPSSAPALDLQAAQWSLSLLAWSVSLLVDRANVGTSLPPELAQSEPTGESACHHWSVDIGLRYLADVVVRAKAAASEDALVTELVDICTRWPLAAVGTQLAWNETRGQVIIDDPCLRRLLLDRIIARRESVQAESPTIKRYIEAYAVR